MGLVFVVVSLERGDSTGKGLMKGKYVQLWLFNIIYTASGMSSLYWIVYLPVVYSMK